MLIVPACMLHGSFTFVNDVGFVILQEAARCLETVPLGVKASDLEVLGWAKPGQVAGIETSLASSNLLLARKQQGATPSMGVPTHANLLCQVS